MPLKQYQKKRNFKNTPEPAGKIRKKSSKLLYVIQKHAASHLHYDFRLELAGVLKSWAVPKGPSLDPEIKRLAVQVEDHPIEYGSFEGNIPAGQYGAGAVMLWDKGQWEPQDPDPIAAYKKGHLSFIIKGKKLHGLWKLIRIKSDPKNWLLIKVKDEYSYSEKNFDITKEEPYSVVTKHDIDEIRSIKSITKNKNSLIKKLTHLVKKSQIPSLISPQLATLVDEIPAGDEWLHEIKLDGYRIICIVENNKVSLYTRSHQNWTNKFPYITQEIEKLNMGNAIFDGEIIALDKNQHSNFQILQNSIREKSPDIIYCIFDLIYFDKFNLSNLSLLDRKKILKKIISKADFSLIRFSDYIIGNGEKLFKNACQLGLEGLVSKKINSPYLQKRNKNWLKIKCIQRQEFVIGGYTQPKGSRKYFGSLLLGYFKGKKLHYCGHVGTGFSEKTLASIAKLLKKYQTDKMPFVSIPPDIRNKSTYWVEPNLIAEVTYLEKTQDGILRHPTFKGLRMDKPAPEVTLETPDSLSKLTHPDRVLYPQLDITKQELAQFYDDIQEWILPYIIKRPLTFLRCPNGSQHSCFYQKHLASEAKTPLYTIDIKENKKTSPYVYIKDISGLIQLVQLGILEIHLWGCHIDKIEKPDMIIFDLDPAPDVEWKKVIAAAKWLRDELQKINLISFVKTTGGKGLHVVVPIKRLYSWEDIKFFASNFVEYLVSLKPDQYTGSMAKSKRTGKIFIDYFRNDRGATAIAPYSTRANEYASISTPLAWNELTTRIKSNTFTIKNLKKRLKNLKADPWKDFFNIKQKLPM